MASMYDVVLGRSKRDYMKNKRIRNKTWNKIFEIGHLKSENNTL